MKTRVSLIFWPCKSKVTPGDFQASTPVVIYCRLTVKGKRIEHSTNLRTTYGNWVADGEHGHVRGKTANDKHINSQLTKLRDELNDLHADLERRGKPVTARALIRAYKAGGSVLDMLGLYDAFLAEWAGLVGVEIAEASHAAAKTRRGLLLAFLKASGRPDLRPEEFSLNMADKMLYWLLTERKYTRNYANKVLQSVSQCLRWGVRREHLDKNPLAEYQFKMTAPGEIRYLGEAELAHLSAAPLAVGCLARVRDCFVFQCWTGLAYADMATLNMAEAEYKADGQGNVRRMLRVTRAKSTTFKGYECVTPLLPEAERVLALYGDVLPVPTNQVYNRYLKQVAELVGLATEKLTSHVGRKTAGTLLLNRGVPLPVVSKFLGHSNTLITQKVYAKLLDTTVVDAFAGLFAGAPAAPAPRELASATPVPVVLRPARRIQEGGGRHE